MKRTTCLIAALLALALVFTGYGFAPSNSVAPKATAEPAATPEEMMGTLEEKENAYVNPFLALRFAPGDDWTFFDREQLMEANGAVSGLLTDEDMAAIARALQGHEAYVLVENSTKMYDTYWVLTNLGINVVVAQAQDLYRITKHPSVVWVGVESDVDLAGISADLRTGLKGTGISCDGKPFVPHVTVGRVKGSPGYRSL